MDTETIAKLTSAIFWLGVILITPMLFTLSRIIARYAYYKFFPLKKITVQHKHNGIIVSEYEIDLTSKVPVNEQIKQIKQRIYNE